MLLRQAVAWYAKVRDLVGVGDFYDEKHLKPLHLVAFAVAIHKGVQALLTTSRLPQYTHGRLNKGDCVCIYCAGDLDAPYPKGMHYGGFAKFQGQRCPVRIRGDRKYNCKVCAFFSSLAGYKPSKAAAHVYSTCPIGDGGKHLGDLLRFLETNGVHTNGSLVQPLAARPQVSPETQ